MINLETKLVLASGSPRRQALLREAGLAVRIMPVEVDEAPQSGEPPRQLAQRLAVAKAQAAAERMPDAELLLGADTIVVHRGEVLGKPADSGEAIAMLSDLKAGQHDVFTGLALLDVRAGRRATDVVRSRVPMRDYAMDEIAEYVASGSPLDKAGAYGIQDDDFQPVAGDLFEDCFTNVMGLPLCQLEKLYAELELDCPVDFVGACFAFGEHELEWRQDG